MPALTYTALDIITAAMIEIGMLAPGEVPDGETGTWAFGELNNLLDVWAARKAYVYSTNFVQYALIPNKSPMTIGPTGDFVVPQRPVRIESCAVRLNAPGSFVDAPRLNIRDADWWAANAVKQIVSSIPTDLYYDNAWENGNLFFWPIPNVALPILLETWQAIAQLQAINDPIGGPGGPSTLPPAYRAALTYTLAEMLCPGAEKELSPTTAGKATAANKAVFGNNFAPPRIATRDAGMPTGRRRRGGFNWASGQPW
jgi:hypothetical protein